MGSLSSRCWGKGRMKHTENRQPTIRALRVRPAVLALSAHGPFGAWQHGQPPSSGGRAKGPLGGRQSTRPRTPQARTRQASPAALRARSARPDLRAVAASAAAVTLPVASGAHCSHRGLRLGTSSSPVARFGASGLWWEPACDLEAETPALLTWTHSTTWQPRGRRVKQSTAVSVATTHS
jgi:hypothetical protein